MTREDGRLPSMDDDEDSLFDRDVALSGLESSESDREGTSALK